MLWSMNRPVKTLLRVAGLAVGIGAVVWALKDRILPAPQIPDEPPPRFRTGAGPETASAVAEAPGAESEGDDDLTELKGIGPAYAARLREAGFTTFSDLAAATPAAISAAGRVSESVSASWIEQAADLA